MHLLCGIHVLPGLKSLWPQQVVHCFHHSLNEQGEGGGRGKSWRWCHESPHILQFLRMAPVSPLLNLHPHSPPQCLLGPAPPSSDNRSPLGLTLM